MTLVQNNSGVADYIVPEPGDVPNSVLGIGFDAHDLDRQAELDELAEAELAGTRPAAAPGAGDALPDEAAAPPAAPVAATAAAPSLMAKLLRTFLFAALGALATALLPIIDAIASGGDVDLSALGSLALAAVAGAIAAGVRAIVAYLPVFRDDAVGMRRSPAVH
jgi:hypothetical protein